MNDRAKLFNLIIDKFFNGVTADNVLEVTYTQVLPGQLMPSGVKIGERQLEVAEIIALKKEADEMKSSRIWKLISDRIQYHAQIKLSKAENKDDVMLPKDIIYTIQLVNDILKTLSGFEANVEPQKKKILTGK